MSLASNFAPHITMVNTGIISTFIGGRTMAGCLSGHQGRLKCVRPGRLRRNMARCNGLRNISFCNCSRLVHGSGAKGPRPLMPRSGVLFNSPNQKAVLCNTMRLMSSTRGALAVIRSPQIPSA